MWELAIPGLLVNCLLQQGIRVDASFKNGFKPLAVAAGEGHVPVVAQLLAAGADANARSHGRTAHDLAEYSGHTLVVELLAQSPQQRERVTAQDTEL